MDNKILMQDGKFQKLISYNTITKEFTYFDEEKDKETKKLTVKNRSDCDSTLKILLETAPVLNFHANLKNMKNFMMCQFVHHETFVCHEPSELESSTSLPGGNLVDGLPPASSFS